VSLAEHAPAGDLSPTDWRPGDKGQITLLSFSHAVQHFYSAAFAFCYPFVVDAFHVSYAMLGLVLGVAGVVGGLLQGVAVLVRRVSARWLLVGQDIGLAASLLFAAVAPLFAVFALARCLGSLVQWPQHPVGSAYLSDRVPHRLALSLSWHTIGGSIGTLAVPLAAGWVTAVWGWRWSLAIFVPFLILGAWLLWRGMDDPGRRGAELVSRASLSLRTVLRRRAVLAVLAAATVAAAGRGLGVLSTYVPAFLHDGRGLDSVATGALFTVVLVGSIIGPVVAGWLGDRVGRRRVLLMVYPAAAVLVAAYTYVGSSIWALAAVGLLVGAFAYAESPLLQSLFADAAQGADSRATFGVYFAVAYGIGALWQVLVGWLVTAHGFQAAFVVMGLSFLAAWAMIAFVRADGSADRGFSPSLPDPA
jgi:MFS family permease